MERKYNSQGEENSMTELTSRERFIAALERRPIQGRVPHFELVFFLTMEAFGLLHPHHRNYYQWDQMEAKERQMHREDMADLYIKTAERFEHDAILLHPNPDTTEEILHMVEIIRRKTGDRYFIMAHGDPTYGLPKGDTMEAFSYRVVDDPDGLKSEAQFLVDAMLERGRKLRQPGGLDGFALCRDYCLNAGPFFSPDQFAEFVAPYLRQTIQGYRGMGYYTIKHTDGNIMPIVDQLVAANPHALHSIDPQAGVDIAEIKRRFGRELCLIGNVNCGLLQTGTEQQAIESVRYALKHGMPGYGYIFSTSNCVYTGLPLSRYELILDVWRKEGNYPS